MPRASSNLGRFFERLILASEPRSRWNCQHAAKSSIGFQPVFAAAAARQYKQDAYATLPRGVHPGLSSNPASGWRLTRYAVPIPHLQRGSNFQQARYPKLRGRWSELSLTRHSFRDSSVVLKNSSRLCAWPWIHSMIIRCRSIRVHFWEAEALSKAHTTLITTFTCSP